MKNLFKFLIIVFLITSCGTTVIVGNEENNNDNDLGDVIDNEDDNNDSNDNYETPDTFLMADINNSYSVNTMNSIDDNTLGTYLDSATYSCETMFVANYLAPYPILLREKEDQSDILYIASELYDVTQRSIQYGICYISDTTFVFSNFDVYSFSNYIYKLYRTNYTGLDYVVAQITPKIWYFEDNITYWSFDFPNSETELVSSDLINPTGHMLSHFAFENCSNQNEYFYGDDVAPYGILDFPGIDLFNPNNTTPETSYGDTFYFSFFYKKEHLSEIGVFVGNDYCHIKGTLLPISYTLDDYENPTEAYVTIFLDSNNYIATIPFERTNDEEVFTGLEQNIFIFMFEPLNITAEITSPHYIIVYNNTQINNPKYRVFKVVPELM